MAQDPLKPKDNGKIAMPVVTAAMNKLPPGKLTSGRDGKGPQKAARAEPKKPESPDARGGVPATSAAIDTMDKPAPKPEAPQLGGPEGAKWKDVDLVAVLARGKKRLERCISTSAENRKNALDDIKFRAGDQWPSDVMAQRNLDRRPCLTVNKLPVFVNQVVNDARQNRPSINVSPVGERGDKEVARFYRGMIRAIERDSAADIAYDTALESAVTCGFGYFRLLTDYAAPDDFDQEIKIVRVRNPFTVYLDPDSQSPDGSDARYGFVSEMIPREEFKEDYPDAAPMPFNMAGVGDTKNWGDKDNIRVAEYFEFEVRERRLVALDTGHTGWYDGLMAVTKADIAAGTIKILREREALEQKVRWYKMTAVEVIEQGDTPWMGIPIIPVIGNEIDVEGKVQLSGIIRNAKDPQRMVNYWETSFTELVALAPKAPFILEEGQLEGHEDQWKQANTKSYPYLVYKGVALGQKPAPPPSRQQFAQVPAGIQQGIQNAANNMMATTGIRFDSSSAERTMDESGKALRELRRSGDLGSFHFVDNAARSLRWAGALIVDAIPKVYDTARVATILREDDKEETVKINPNQQKGFEERKVGPTPEKPQGGIEKIFNPKVGKYGVTVTIGPSYATKRIESAEAMMQFARALPQAAALVMDLIAKNMDWPGAEEMATRLAKALPPNLLSPDIKDVPPQVQAMLQSMQQQLQQMAMENKQLLAAVNDKQADRALLMEKINKDFEAKVLGIIQRSQAASETAMGRQVKDLSQGVKALTDAMEPRQAAQSGPDVEIDIGGDRD